MRGQKPLEDVWKEWNDFDAAFLYWYAIAEISQTT